MENRSLSYVVTNHSKRMLAIVMCVLLAFSMMPAAATAEVQEDTSGETALKLVCKDGERPLGGVHFDLYRISENPSDSENETIKNLAEILEKADADARKSAAEQLAEYIQVQGLQPTLSGSTDENGQAVFPAIRTGIYYVSGEGKTFDNVNYVPQKTLVKIEAPATDDEGGVDPVVLPVIFDKTGVETAAAPKTGQPDTQETQAEPEKQATGTAETVSDSKEQSSENSQTDGKLSEEDGSKAPSRISIMVRKRWDESSDYPAENRPEKAVIKLTSSDLTDRSFPKTGEIFSSSENGLYTFDSLPVTDKDGKTITYTVTENAIRDYVPFFYSVTTEYMETMDLLEKSDRAFAEDMADILIAENLVDYSRDAILSLGSGHFLRIKWLVDSDFRNIAPQELIDNVKWYYNLTLTAKMAEKIIEKWNERFEEMGASGLADLKKAYELFLTFDTWNPEPNASVTISEDYKTAKIDASKAAASNEPVVLMLVNSTIPNWTRIDVTKVWLDAKNSAKKRPDSVKIKLLGNGNAIGDLPLEEGKRNWFAIFPALESGNSVWYEPSEEKNNWFATFTNLPVTDSSGKEMTYTVSEDKVTDYTTRMLVGNMDTLDSR